MNVQAFMKSWGMYPGEEDTDENNPEVIRNEINHPCFCKLLAEAEQKHGAGFAVFCNHVTDATDDSFYLGGVGRGLGRLEESKPVGGPTLILQSLA